MRGIPWQTARFGMRTIGFELSERMKVNKSQGEANRTRFAGRPNEFEVERQEEGQVDQDMFKLDDSCMDYANLI
eukprot:762930-Hanusia_phi.AAC.3